MGGCPCIPYNFLCIGSFGYKQRTMIMDPTLSIPRIPDDFRTMSLLATASSLVSTKSKWEAAANPTAMAHP